VLKELSKKDELWRKFAFSICKNRMLADDLVGDMYLKIHEYFLRHDLPNKEIKDSYIYRAIQNLFKNHVTRVNEGICIEEFHYLHCPNETFYPDDEQQKALDAYEKIDWKQKHLLELVYDMSYRDIEKQYPLIHYTYAFTQVKEARKIILDR